MERPIPFQTLFTGKKKKKKKTAEQDVAKIAMKHVSKKIRDKGFPLVLEVCYVMMANL